jgi:hypothetical protein
MTTINGPGPLASHPEPSTSNASTINGPTPLASHPEPLAPITDHPLAMHDQCGAMPQGKQG